MPKNGLSLHFYLDSRNFWAFNSEKACNSELKNLARFRVSWTRINLLFYERLGPNGQLLTDPITEPLLIIELGSVKVEKFQ